MTTRHSRAAGALTPNGPGSEAIAPASPIQAKTLIALGDETPAEHIRNALQIVTGAPRSFTLDRVDAYVTLHRDEVDALERRLTLALEQLAPREGRQWMTDATGELETPRSLEQLEERRAAQDMGYFRPRGAVQL